METNPANNIVAAFDTLLAIQKTRSRKQKEQLFKQCWMQSGTIIEILDIGLNDYRHFGFTLQKKDIEVIKAHGSYPRSYHEVMYGLISALDDKPSFMYKSETLKEEIIQIISNVPDKYKDLMINLVNKKAKLGITGESINKITKDETFPVFKVALCQPYDGRELEYPHIIEKKIDGVRAVIIIDGKGNCKALSRKGKPLYNLEHIFEQLKCFNGRVFDGELFIKDWNTTMKAVRSSKNKPDVLAKFHIFDILIYHDFMTANREITSPQKQRKNALRAIKRKRSEDKEFNKWIKFSIGSKVSSRSEVYEKLKEFEAKGHEGAVLKDPRAGYSFKRSWVWAKVVSDTTADGKIISVNEGTPLRMEDHDPIAWGNLLEAGNLINTTEVIDVMSSVTVKLEDGKEVRVGTGWTDIDKVKMYSKPEDYIGKTIEVKYRRDSGTGSILFPVMHRWREDKD